MTRDDIAESSMQVDQIADFAMQVGVNVRVVMGFPSNNANRKGHIPIGSEGWVKEIDEDGDAKFDFDELGSHWVKAQYFIRLIVVERQMKSFDIEGQMPEFSIQVGVSVRVVMGFPSNNARYTKRVPPGSEGRIDKIDEDGDAQVDFGDLGSHWVEAKYFNRMIAPEPQLKSFDIEGIANYIQECGAKRIVVLCGAGISTSSGIPDFKTLYASDRCASLPDPTAIFEIEYFKQNPAVFYELAKEIWPGGFDPSPAHYFILLLHLKGLLLKCFTQNIDTLERQAGIPDDMVVYSHGNFDSAHVVGHNWGVTVDSSDLEEAVKTGTWEELNRRHGGLVKPKISFYGESLPECFFEHRNEVESCDLLIVMGTSLRVAPFNKLVGNANSTAPRLLIDVNRVGLCDDLEHGFRFHLDESNWRDVFYEGSIDDGVRSLASALGWGTELEELVQSRGA